LPKDLADVLHYFLPEAQEKRRANPPTQARRAGSNGAHRLHPAALPLVAVPIGDCDVVRAAFCWNLVFEIARLGGEAAIVTPAEDAASPLWPEPDSESIGAEVIASPASNIGELYRAALDVAVSRAAESRDGGLILVRIPPSWLTLSADAGNLLRWTLLFTSSDSRELLETYGLAKLLMAASPSARVGVTIHGARRLDEAEQAFTRLTRSAERHIGRGVVSYGLLVDDLDVYRAIVAQRPIALTHPQSPAARALRDVAKILLDDARNTIVA
jgi:hypothetical protein